nr:Werner syndrome ATP-dependent helicase-like [Aedes albopictus]
MSHHLDPTAAHLTFLEARFGHSSFRPHQWNIIRSVLEEKRDQCAVMPTGSGKSLLYQYPAVFLNRLTLVVAPLISLMHDQVLALKGCGIPACFLVGPAQNGEVIRQIQAGQYRLVYVTPEYLFEDMGKVLLESVLDQLVLIAVDEAHCVSKWSHDYRLAFGELHKIRDICPDVPILAVTATATPTVRKDIVNGLRLRSPQMTCSGFDRPNLSFHVKTKISINLTNDIVSLIKRGSPGGSVIIYCVTRAQTVLISQQLTGKGIYCTAYHAGIELEKRTEIHEKFVRGQLKVIAATSAFGMGIHNSNVRLVVHYGAARDIECYYREIGRAGRDGLPACCVMYWSEEDFRKHEYLREKNSHAIDQREQLLELSSKMRQYLKSKSCRRKFILNYFEGKKQTTLPARRDCCDNCVIRFKNVPQPAPVANVSPPTKPSTASKAKFAEELLEAIRSTRGQLAILHGCKPHMVATRNAMQELVKMRPHTLDELRSAKIDGFSEAKIQKFGQPFVDCILLKVQELPTIQQILQQYPLEKEKITFFQITTWTLFKEGRSIQEIAKFRHQTEMQIYQQLADAIKHGLSFGWSDFERVGLSRGLFQEIKLKLLLVPSTAVDLNAVKKTCSSSVSQGQIALVLGFVQVRSHLDKNQLLYREEQTYDLMPVPIVPKEENPDQDHGGEEGMSASLMDESDFLGFSNSVLSDAVIAIVSSDDDE